MTPRRIGNYEILGSIGAGGMGEVYRARDPRLDRIVAIKVLSIQLAADADALARFEREAMSVAKLSHPNILAIFEFGRDGGTSFVVTELIEGETLRARLEAGPLPQRRALAYGLQIVRGVAAAHARGIVHRDLKPENVMITRDDQVKILDFGLAKSIDLGQSDATRSPSLATSAGVVMGTFGYMAPEQVRGLPVDHRADIFAFGAVLYEMLSGTPAFRGETPADTMSAVLSKEPPEFDAPRVSIAPGVDRTVRRCLEKSPELRFQSANDLAFALETLSGTTTSTSTSVQPSAAAAAPHGTRSAARLPWAIAAAAVLGAAASWLTRGSAPADPAWSQVTRITEAAGQETGPTISPDGNTVAYAVRVNGSWDIYSQRVGGRNATPVVNDPQRDEGGAAFSPDGALIAFHESDDQGGIFVAGATGESVRRLTDAGFDPAWSPDGQQIAFTTEEVGDPASRLGESRMYIVPAAGGSPRMVLDSDAVQASFSPSGDRLVYWSNTGGQRDIYTVAASGGARVAITDDAAIDWCPVWSPDGRYVYFSSDRGGAMNLWRVAVNASGGPMSPPEPVTTGVQAGSALPRFSKNGMRLVFRSRIDAINPVAIPLDPVTLRAGTPTLLDTQNTFRVPSDVSPDGRLIAYFSIGERQEDVFVSAPGGPIRRITDDAPRDRGGMFTPDGRSLIFYSNRESHWGVWMIGIDGGGLRKLVVPPTGAVYPVISPKGDRLVYISQDGHPFTVPISASGAGQPAPLPGGAVDGKSFAPFDWTRDGARLAGYVASDSGRPAGVAVYDFSAAKTSLVSKDEAYAARWLGDDRRIIYFGRNGEELVVVDTLTGTRSTVDVRLPAPSTNDLFALSPDKRTIYYGAARAEADIWIVERGPGLQPTR